MAARYAWQVQGSIAPGCRWEVPTGGPGDLGPGRFSTRAAAMAAAPAFRVGPIGVRVRRVDLDAIDPRSIARRPGVRIERPAAPILRKSQAM